tara:strand:- start:5020 stop:6987 length:1968 start_codon:yes stop_codon:yes gene_type:complete
VAIEFVVLLATVAALGFISLFSVFIKFSYRNRWILGVYYSLVVFFTGLLCASYYNYNQVKTEQNEPYFYAQLLDHPHEKEKTVKLSLQVYTFKESQHDYELIAYAQKDSLLNELEVGDFILFQGRPSSIEGSKNPATFNYASYLARKNIFHQLYLPKGSWKKVTSSNGFIPIIWAKKLQRSIRDVFNQYVTHPSAKAILFALVLGDKTELDDELSADFAVAGAMHVLAVSGLHVGIIYKVLEGLFLFLLAGKSKRYSRAFLLIILLWLYAFVTGLSPSVLRAVLMFSFIIAAKARENSPNFYNTLAASAFIILIIWPNYIYHVGFQLSYSAVIAIVSIYPLLYQFVATQYKVVNWISSLAIVSIAAQVGTAPFAIYYFHQFPTYFIVTNLIAIPAAFALLSGGLLLIPFHFISADLAKFFGLLIDWMGEVLGSLISRISVLPYASIDELWISQPQLILLYICLGFTAYTFSNLWKRGIFYSGLLIIITLISFISSNYLNTNQKVVVLYSIQNNTVLGFIKGEEAYIYSDFDSITNSNDWDYQIKPSLDSMGISSVSLSSSDFDWVSMNVVNGNVIINTDFSQLCIRNNESLDKFLLNQKEVIVVENNLEIPVISMNVKQQYITSSVKWWKINEIEENTSISNLHKLYTNAAVIIK